MRILSLDPSSTCVGWAVLSGPPDTLHTFGRLAARERDPSLTRIDSLTAQLLVLANRQGADAIVMEWSAGKIARGMPRIHGLAVLGQAQGTYRQALLGAGYRVETVTETEWTAGKTKATRARVVSLEWPDYAAWQGQDGGLDTADAIGLGCWWLRQELYRGDR